MVLSDKDLSISWPGLCTLMVIGEVGLSTFLLDGDAILPTSLRLQCQSHLHSFDFLNSFVDYGVGLVHLGLKVEKGRA